MFRNRAEAGKKLADAVARLAPKDPVVLALPRGGVPVAVPVATRLNAPLDLVLVRKIGMPGHAELAAGAIVDGSGHDVVFNDAILKMANLSAEDFQDQIADKLAEIETRRARYLGGRAPEPVEGRSAIVVDDGIATGATMTAALKALSRRGAARVILAVPVAPDDTLARLAPLVDDVVCLNPAGDFRAVGQYYMDFRQVDDSEVTDALTQYKGTV